MTMDRYVNPLNFYQSFLIFVEFNILTKFYSVQGGSVFSGFFDKEEKGADRDFDECIRDTRFYCLFVASGIMVGITNVYMFNIGKINAYGKTATYEETYINVSWLSDVSARLIGGLIAFFFRNKINEYVFALLGTGFGFVGFLICALGSLYFGTLFVSIAMGLWWVMPALIVMDDGGVSAFAGIWGTVLTANFWGLLFYGLLTAGFWSWFASPLLPIYIFYMVSCVIAGGITFWAYFMDTKK